jgi:hypothetical protein
VATVLLAAQAEAAQAHLLLELHLAAPEPAGKVLLVAAAKIAPPMLTPKLAGAGAALLLLVRLARVLPVVTAAQVQQVQSLVLR